MPAVQRGTAQYSESLNPSQTIHMEIVLALRNSQQFQACAASISDPNSPNYDHFLTSTTLSPYLPTPGETASVISYLRNGGFTTSSGPSPVVIVATGTVAAAEKLFGVNLNIYKQGSTTFFASSSNPMFPQNLVSMVTGITGLDNYSLARPMDQSTCGSPLGTVGSESPYPICPQGIQVGYSLSSLYTSGYDGYNGTGVTVAIVDVAGDPNIQGAINTFDTQYSLPAITLGIQYPDGTPTSYDPGWASEQAMDVEAVHSAAPGASIVMMVTPYYSDPVDSIDYVATHHLASIVSNSWGYGTDTGIFPSSFVTAEDERLALDAAQGLTILFATGDLGAYNGGISPGTDFPASDPHVLAVGATNLNLKGCDGTSCTAYKNETGGSISGGGYSGFFTEPSWQASTIGSRSGRAIPDVSMVGDMPGIWVYSTLSDLCGTTSPTANAWFDCSGTSLSTPLWAGVLAVAQQERGAGFGNIDPLIYQLGHGSSYTSIFHDVTSGNNGYYSAGTGWDPVTGWGSPSGANLAAALAAVGCDAGVVPPTITSVTGTIMPAAGNGAWSITINGACFGATQPAVDTLGDGSVTTQPSSTTPAITIVDQTQGWGAGFGADLIGIYLTSWTDNSITISGFGSSSGVGPAALSTYPIAPGDQVGIYIAGPSCGTSSSPLWPSTNSPPPASNWPSNCEAAAFTTVGLMVPTPMFPLGSVLGVVAPLAALGIYTMARMGKGLALPKSRAEE